MYRTLHSERQTNKGQSCNCKSVTCLVFWVIVCQSSARKKSPNEFPWLARTDDQLYRDESRRDPHRSVRTCKMEWSCKMMEHVVNTIHPSVHHQIMTFQSIPLNSIQRRNVNRFGQSRRIARNTFEIFPLNNYCGM